MYELTALIVCNVLMFLVAAGMGALYVWDRRDSKDRERELLAAVIAEQAGDYLNMLEAIKTSPKDKLKQMQVENDLALQAAQLQKREGLPVTN